MKELFYTRFQTLWGACVVAQTGNGISSISLPENSEKSVQKRIDQHERLGYIKKITPLLKQTKVQVLEFLRGDRTTFSIPLVIRGTAFQAKVWEALQKIPYGQTWSYQDVAKAIRNPKALRAVGMANNRNPLPLLIPCHRVIGKDGSMVGFGGGISLKRKLLALERR